MGGEGGGEDLGGVGREGEKGGLAGKCPLGISFMKFIPRVTERWYVLCLPSQVFQFYESRKQLHWTGIPDRRGDIQLDSSRKTPLTTLTV